jgi:formylglycine-generating enzyme required for sulfatase activity
MKKIITLVVLFFLLQNSKANNVVINNVSLVNNGPDNIYVQFDLSWENSWRVLNGPANYDGVWVYFKYKTATGNWVPLFLNSLATADLLPTGLDYWRSFFGAVIHRSATNIGNGNIIATGVRLAIDNTVAYNIELRAFAVEMVYIPGNTDGYNIWGDGDGTTESTNAFHNAGTNNYHLGSGAQFSVDVNAIDDTEIEEPNTFFVGNGGGGNGYIGLSVNLFFPAKSAMWCMKYEVTQGAYRDFLNTLTLTQQTTRTANAPTAATGTGALTTSGSFRNFLEIKTPSASGLPAVYGCDASNNNLYDEATDGEFVACNFLSWPDLAAWLDWAGLAPMTEMNFENICRGHTGFGSPISPILGEFAWGNTSIIATPLTLATPFTATETVSNSSTVLGNATWGSLSTGPLRNGVFATPTSNRITSGASFFGVMDMSGNVAEVCVTVGDVAGRSYNKGGTDKSSIGDGILSVNGNARVNYWPGNVANATLETTLNAEVTTAAGTKLRGGVFSSSAFSLRISDRSVGAASVSRLNYQGGRGVIVLAMY